MPANWCNNTNLSLTYTQQGTNVTLIGNGGFAPYQYSWINQSNFGTNTHFNNLIPGTYIAYIHDSRGCQKSKTITIPLTAVDPMQAVYPQNTQQNVPVDNLVFIWSSGVYANNQVFDLYLKTNSGSYNLLASNLTDQEFIYEQSLTYLTNYTWKVVVKNGSGTQVHYKEFTFSSIDEDQIIPQIPVIVQPQNLVTLDTLTYTFKWQAQPELLFNFYCDTIAGNTLNATNLTISEYKVERLINFADYFWKVAVKNPVTELFEVSPVYQFSTDTIEMPQTFELINPANAVTLNNLPFYFTWNSLGNDFVYDLYLDLTDGSSLFMENITGTSFGITGGIVDLETYYWKVVAKNSLCGHSIASSVRSFSTDTIQIPPVNLVLPVNNYISTTSSVVFSWTNLGANYVYSLYLDENDASTAYISDFNQNTYTVINLLDMKSYKWKVIATNIICGRSVESPVWSFTTDFPTVQDIDGNIYNTVKINNKKWMRENLKTTKYTDGSPILNGTSIGDYYAESSPKYYFNYNDDVANVTTYGRLYTWFTVNDTKGVCPAGWRVPSITDMDALTLDNTYIGGNLKEAGITHWIDPNTGADNTTNFTALPAGARYNFGFNWLGSYAIYWTTYSIDVTNAVKYELHYNDASIWSGSNDKKGGYSVRCVID